MSFSEEMSSSDGKVKCRSCEQESKVYRLIKDEIVWTHGGEDKGQGKISLTIHDKAGPLCKKCVVLLLDFLKDRVDRGKALVAPSCSPNIFRARKFKVLPGGKV